MMQIKAFAINEAGDIVGSHPSSQTAPHLWRATGEEIHYPDTTATVGGFGFGLNDGSQPDVVGGGNGRVPFVYFGGSTSRSVLSRGGGTQYYDGAWDVSNPTSTQPLRIVGAVAGKPKVWTLR